PEMATKQRTVNHPAARPPPPPPHRRAENPSAAPPSTPAIAAAPTTEGSHQSDHQPDARDHQDDGTDPTRPRRRLVIVLALFLLLRDTVWLCFCNRCILPNGRRDVAHRVF